MQHRRSLCPAVLLVMSLVACSREPILVPITVPAQAAPAPSMHTVAATTQTDPVVPACSVFLADVRDIRDDTVSMGTMGWRAVRSADSVQWVRSAVQTLDHDPHIRFVDNDAQADLSVQIELVKAYIMGITTQKSANVVIRAHFLRHATDLGQIVLRGRETGANWANGEGETQSALDTALGTAVRQLHDQVLSYCAKPPSAGG